MKFLDAVKLTLKAGNGGAGSGALFQDWHQKYPHPDGGNGGNGGSIFLIANKNINTLAHYAINDIVVAKNGKNGNKKKQDGLNGKDIYLQVPIGTVVFLQKKEQYLFNFTQDQEKFKIAAGGKGGLGNAFLKSRKNHQNKLGQPGTLGEVITVWLDLALIAQVAFLGLPNVGKSSLLNSITNAKAKTANYQFTTLIPNLGVMVPDSFAKKKVVLADLPGIIANACQNKGLGNRFLKHAERIQLFLHIVDLSLPASEIIDNFHTINHELHSYNSDFTKIPQILVGNKSDQNNQNFDLKTLQSPQFSILTRLTVSAKTKERLPFLKKIIFQTLAKQQNWQTVLDLKLAQLKKTYTYNYNWTREIRLQKIQSGVWRLSGAIFLKLLKKYDLTIPDQLLAFLAVLKTTPVFYFLTESGIKKGDLVEIFNQHFYWID